MKICFTPNALQQVVAAYAGASLGLVALHQAPTPGAWAAIARARRLTDRLIVAQVSATPWLTATAQQQLQQAGVDAVLALPTLQPPILTNATAQPIALLELLRSILAFFPQGVWVPQTDAAMVRALQELLRAFPGLFALEIVAEPL